jgi:uroporphyrin-III C-methyltransferase
VVLATGHRADENSAADWKELAASDSTLAIYMPGSNYAEISRHLTAAGFKPETPCAIISRATTPQQQIHSTTVSQLARAPKLAAPTLLFVGEVVRLANRTSTERGSVAPEIDQVWETALAHPVFLPVDKPTVNEEPLV